RRCRGSAGWRLRRHRRAGHCPPAVSARLWLRRNRAAGRRAGGTVAGLAGGSAGDLALLSRFAHAAAAQRQRLRRDAPRRGRWQGLLRFEQETPMSEQLYYFEDMQEGMEASFSKTVTEADIVQFAGVTGDFNPVHVNAEFAATTMFKQRIAHGMLSAGFISTVLGMRLP